MTEATAKEIDQEMKIEADTSAKFAEESPYPPKSEITKDVYQVAKTLHEGWIQLKSRQQNKETPNKIKLKSAFRAQG